MGSIDQFPLNAEISLSEFRSEEIVTTRLGTFHRLRVRRRNDVLGVFLDSAAWHELVSHVERLETEIARREDEAARAIVAARAPGAIFEPGSAEHTAEIDRAYEELVAARTSNDA